MFAQVGHSQVKPRCEHAVKTTQALDDHELSMANTLDSSVPGPVSIKGRKGGGLVSQQCGPASAEISPCLTRQRCMSGPTQQ